MPLQNRVDPFGEVHAVAARGMFTGNRGVIHDPATKTLLTRRWTTKAWIICDCAFRGRRREVMGRNAPSGNAGWTELFFLDEVTALAAGHRPCFYCRRERAVEFARCFAAGQGRDRISAPEMDVVLHLERWASRVSGPRPGLPAPPPPLTPPRKGEGYSHAVVPDGIECGHNSTPMPPSPLRGGVRGGGDYADHPSGAMIAFDGYAYAKAATGLVRWSFEGWKPAHSPGGLPAPVTPPSTVAALAQGYVPAWHPSARP